MNTKLNLVSIVAVIFIIATAGSPRSSLSQGLLQAQSERNYQLVPLPPVTSGQDYGNDEGLADYPLNQFHSACSSANSQRQDLCVELEPNFVPGSIYLSGNSSTDNEVFPSQKLHSACVSENIQREESCVD
jgi:hypothetical protein